MLTRLFFLSLVLSFLISCKNDKSNTDAKVQAETENDSLIYPEETHFKSIRQITFGGDNAEAYWSFDDKQIVFQSNNKAWNVNCDQMFLMNTDETFTDQAPPMVSTGKGRTTCSYFMPDNKHILYASTHLGGDDCPETPLRQNGK